MAVATSCSAPRANQEELSDLREIRQTLPFDVPLALIVAARLPQLFDHINEMIS
jgi:hypothetical protein